MAVGGSNNTVPMRLTRQLLRTPFPGGHLTRSYHVASAARHTLTRHGLPQIPLIQSSSLLSRPRRNPLTAIQAERALSTSADIFLNPSPSVIESAVETTEHLISSLHYTSGLPWYLTIPLLALSINLVTRWPITVYTNGIHRRRAELKPLLTATFKKIAMRVVAETEGRLSKAEQEAQGTKEFIKQSAKLYRAYGVESWKDYLNLGILPIWLLNIEALRRLSGSPKGLLGLLFSSKDNVDATTTASASTSETASNMLDPSAAIPSPSEPITHLFDPATATTQQVTDVATATFTGDPSLITEGCLWFPDLTVADPYHILPTVLSAMMIYNVLPDSPAAMRAVLGVGSSSLVGTKKSSLRLQRVLLLLAVAVGPLTSHLPAAIHLYWVSSTAITMGMKKLADHLWPMPKAAVMKPCKLRPTIQLPRREKKADQ